MGIIASRKRALGIGHHAKAVSLPHAPCPMRHAPCAMPLRLSPPISGTGITHRVPQSLGCRLSANRKAGLASLRLRNRYLGALGADLSALPPVP
jgi:hypothetical protein